MIEMGVIEMVVMHAIAVTEVTEVFVLRTELVDFYHYDSAQSHYNTIENYNTHYHTQYANYYHPV